MFHYVPDLTALYTQFQTGAVDYTGIQGITADHYNEAVKLPGRSVTAGPSATCESITMNLSHPALRDPAVREALYYAMDKKSIIDAIYYGLPKPTETFLPSQSWRTILICRSRCTIRRRRSRSLMRRDGSRVPAASARRMACGCRSSTPRPRATTCASSGTVSLLQQTWKEIGADMQIKNMPAAVIWADYFNMSKYESVMIGQNQMTGPDPDVTIYYSSKATMAKGGSGQNTMEYDNSKVDALLAEGATTLDQSKRIPLYRELQAAIRHDLPMLPIFQYARIEGTKAGLMGYEPSVYVQSNCWNIVQWYWAT